MSEEFKINGSIYDISQVSKKGIEKDDTIKKNKAFNLIFDALNTAKKDDKLDSKELATLFSDIKKSDSNNDKDISDKELEQITKELNKQSKDGTEIKASDIKSFFTHVMSLTADDDKISVESALKAESETDVDTDTDSGSDSDTDSDSNLHTYTVQMDESYTDIIKRSLKAKGIENPTEEQIQEEKDNFEKNNPGCVKERKGVQYLLVGAKVKLEGDLGDKDNSQEQIDLWVDKYINHKDVSEKEGTQDEAKEDPAIAQKAKDAGYRQTYASKSNGVYYDEKTKTHYRWDVWQEKFVKMDNVKTANKDGTYTDTKGKKHKLSDLSVDKKAKEKGFRRTDATDSNGVYYDEKSKTHYRWDSSKQDFVKMDGVKSANKDGTYTDNNGKKHSLSDPAADQKAEEKGYRHTYASDSKGVYYDEKTKTHYRWDVWQEKFVKMDNVKMANKDGTYTDTSGKKHKLSDLSVDKKAKEKGFRRTDATDSNGVYYDEKSKTHYRYDSSKQDFVKMDGVKSANKDGTYTGTDGKTHKF